MGGKRSAGTAGAASCGLLSCKDSAPVAAKVQALPTPALIKALLDRDIGFLLFACQEEYIFATKSKSAPQKPGAT
jgi:hypothetical protein